MCDDWRYPGEDGLWRLRCVNGHEWVAREQLPLIGDGRRGEMIPAECPVCGEGGEVVDC
jgi:hypothetical protein